MEAARTNDDMGYNNLEEENEPEPGDMVVFPRRVYKHYGVAVDKKHVVHLTAGDPGFSGSNLSSATGSYGEVRKDRVSDVGKNYQVIKRNKTTPGVRDPEEIVCKAEAMVGTKKYYNVYTNNCEHFATELCYGAPESEQTFWAKIIGGLVVAAGVIATVFMAILRRR
ncbi:phospholipase A and acyltransferase 4-like [Anolis sagrei]|uniref:phospholipase A and acyltransferase 4-like n=1 Tax=Anolis sagrei TaxID=38937 RepID=UPI0035205BF8